MKIIVSSTVNEKVECMKPYVSLILKEKDEQKQPRWMIRHVLKCMQSIFLYGIEKLINLRYIK